MTILLDSRSRGKNKERASSGNGGSSGILLSMDMVSTSSYAVYVKAISLSFVTWTIGYSSFMVIRFVHFYLPFQDKTRALTPPIDSQSIHRPSAGGIFSTKPLVTSRHRLF